MIDRYSLPQMKNLWSEENKYFYWAKIEKAHLEVFVEKGEVDKKILSVFDAALQKKTVLDFENREKETKHDVIAFVAEIGEAMGQDGSYLHKGLTSSDVVDTAFVLRIKAALEIIFNGVTLAREELAKKSLQYQNTICMGRTHGIHAEPISFGQVLLSYFAEINRVHIELSSVIQNLNFGKLSGAVGTYSQLSPEFEFDVLQKLNLSPEIVATQIIPRDHFVKIAYSLLYCSLTIERFATNMRHWARTELGEVTEPFSEKQKGSSAMPHKKNPILSENLCGLARTIKGYFSMIVDNAALWHERDISHSSCERIAFPDMFVTLDFMLDRFLKLIQNMVVNEKAMKFQIQRTGGLWASQTLLTKMVSAGMARTTSYEIIQKISLQIVNKMHSELISKDEFYLKCKENEEIKKYINETELKEIFNENRFLKYTAVIFERAFRAANFKKTDLENSSKISTGVKNKKE